MRATDSIQKCTERRIGGVSEPIKGSGDLRVGFDGGDEADEVGEVPFGASSAQSAERGHPSQEGSEPRRVRPGAGAPPSGKRARTADPGRTEGSTEGSNGGSNGDGRARGEHLLQRPERVVAVGSRNETHKGAVVVGPVTELHGKASDGTGGVHPLMDRDAGRAGPSARNGLVAACGATDGASVVVPDKHALIAAAADGVASVAAIERANYGERIHGMKTNWAFLLSPFRVFRRLRPCLTHTRTFAHLF